MECFRSQGQKGDLLSYKIPDIALGGMQGPFLVPFYRWTNRGSEGLSLAQVFIAGLDKHFYFLQPRCQALAVYLLQSPNGTVPAPQEISVECDMKCLMPRFLRVSSEPGKKWVLRLPAKFPNSRQPGWSNLERMLILIYMQKSLNTLLFLRESCTRERSVVGRDSWGRTELNLVEPSCYNTMSGSWCAMRFKRLRMEARGGTLPATAESDCPEWSPTSATSPPCQIW